jgi:hypothetical protein
VVFAERPNPVVAGEIGVLPVDVRMVLAGENSSDPAAENGPRLVACRTAPSHGTGVNEPSVASG